MKKSSSRLQKLLKITLLTVLGIIFTYLLIVFLLILVFSFVSRRVEVPRTYYSKIKTKLGNQFITINNNQFKVHKEANQGSMGGYNYLISSSHEDTESLSIAACGEIYLKEKNTSQIVFREPDLDNFTTTCSAIISGTFKDTVIDLNNINKKID